MPPNINTGTNPRPINNPKSPFAVFPPVKDVTAQNKIPKAMAAPKAVPHTIDGPTIPDLPIASLTFRASYDIASTACCGGRPSDQADDPYTFSAN